MTQVNVADLTLARRVLQIEAGAKRLGLCQATSQSGHRHCRDCAHDLVQEQRTIVSSDPEAASRGQSLVVTLQRPRTVGRSLSHAEG